MYFTSRQQDIFTEYHLKIPIKVLEQNAQRSNGKLTVACIIDSKENPSNWQIMDLDDIQL